MYIWLWMLSHVAYAIYVGIIKHVLHYRKKKELIDAVGEADQGNEQNAIGTNAALQHNKSQVPLQTAINAQHNLA